MAEIRSPYGSTVRAAAPTWLVRLEKQGHLRPGAPNDPDLYPLQERILPAGTSSADLLDEERGER